jgi:hypothetical protein
MESIDKLSRIPPYIPRRIVTLNESGLNNCKIRATLIREDNVQISRPGISLILKRYNATGVIDNQNKGICANVRKNLHCINVILQCQNRSRTNVNAHENSTLYSGYFSGASESIFSFWDNLK